MRSRIAVLLTLIFFLAIRSTYAYDIEEHKPPTSSSQGLSRIGIYMVEEASGRIGAVVGQLTGVIVATMVVQFEDDPVIFQDYPTLCLIQFFPGAIGATASTVLTGKILRQGGSLAGAFIGSALGSLIAFPSAYWIFRRDVPWLGLYAPGFGSWPYFSTCISTGAVIGYNYGVLKSNKMELLQCVVGCAAVSIALNILIGQLFGGFFEL